MTQFLLLGAALFLAAVAASAKAEDKPARTDRYGDPLPAGAVARVGTIRLRHASEVTSLAFSPDSKRITSATPWFDVGVWDARTGQGLAFRSSRQQTGLFRATVSSDGSLCAGRTDDGELGVQESLNGKMLYRFAGKKEACEGIAFSCDNHWLASADRDGNTYLWDLRLGKLAQHFKAKPRATFDDFCHTFAPDGRIFVQARADDITFWDTQTGKEIRRVNAKNEREWPGSAAVSPDGELLAVRIAYDRIDLREIQTGRLVRRIAEQWNDVGPVFSLDGKHIVTGRETGEISFWEVETGKLVRTLTMPAQECPRSLAFSPDGKSLAVGGSDHALHLWDLTSGKESLTARHRLGGTPSARILGDGKTLLVHCLYDVNRKSATIDSRLSFWDLEGGFLREAKLAPDKAHAFELSSDARTVAYGTGPNFGFMFRPSPNKYLRSSIRLCDAASGKELIKVNEVPCQIHDFTFSPNDRFLLVNAFNAGPNEEDYEHIDTLQLWKRPSPDRLEKVSDLPVRNFLSRYCVSPDSRWVVVTAEAGYRFYDCETGRLLRSWRDTSGSAVAVSPSGRVLVARDAGDARTGRVVLVWERATGKTVCKLDCKPGQTDWAPLAVSPDGKFVAGCLDREVIALWNAFTGKQVEKLAGHRGDVRSLFFSPDGRYLVSTSADTTILIWDWKANLPKGPENGHLSTERLERLWQNLHAADAKEAYAAIAALVQSPGQALDLLQQKLRPADAEEQRKYLRWIADLDNDSFETREKATKELADAVERAEAALRKALGGPLSAEARRRVNHVLDRLPTAAPHSTTLATFRSLEVLEMINAPAARRFIDQLSQDNSDPFRQREAAETLKRVQR
jgi:WD40 repeat protein